MTDRTTKVTLTAQVTGYLAAMDQAAKKTRETATESKKLAEQQAALKQVARDLGIGLAAIGSIAAAAATLAVVKFAEFDQAMSNVKAATQETSENMDLLRTAALEAGARTVFSATEAANAVEELGKAGLSTTDILNGGLDAALDLASAGGLGVADAAGIASVALKTFGLQGKDMAHVADLLAAGAGKAMGGVGDLGEAMTNVGQTASSMGLSIDETVTALTAFASAGIIGGDAGTGFKSMLMSLSSPSAEASRKMDELGISAYDAQGNFVGLSKFAGNLQGALKNLTVEQQQAATSIIFGSYGARAATVLYKEGAKGIDEWTKAVSDQGFAARVAADRLDNLKGDIEQLGGAFDTALIQSGSASNEVLRAITQSLTGMVDGFNKSGPVVQTGALVLAAVTAAAALTGGAFITLVPKIQATRLAMQAMNISGGTLAKGFGKGGAVLLAITALAGAMSGMGSIATLSEEQLARLDAVIKTDKLKQLNKEFADAHGNTSSFAQALGTLFTSDFFNSYQGGPAQLNGAIKAISFGMIDLGAWADTDRAKFNHLGEALGNLAKDDFPLASEQFNKFLKMTDGSDESIRQLLSAFPQYAAALRALASEHGKTLTEQELFTLAQGKGEIATKLATDATRRHAGTLGTMGAAADDTTGSVNTLADALDGFNDVQFTADDAISAFHQSMLDINKAMGADGFTGTLSESTQEGIDNNRMLRGLAEDSNTAAAKVLALTGNQDDANAILAEGRKKLEDIGGAFGLSGDKLQGFIDKYIASPKELDFQAKVMGIGEMDTTVAAFYHRWNGATVNLNMTGSNKLGSGILGRAEGGILPGTPSRRDNMLIAAASGEFLINAMATARNRPALEYINAGGTIPGYASGGLVGGAPTYAPPAPYYMQAPVASSSGVVVHVSVPVQHSLIGNEDYLASKISSVVTDAVKRGTLSRDWNVRV